MTTRKRSATRPRLAGIAAKQVLVYCRRRCALCFGLRADARQKEGQIAHLDQDRTNNRPENLAFLCLDHHESYDRTSRQARKLSAEEVRYYQGELYAHLKVSRRAKKIRSPREELRRSRHLSARWSPELYAHRLQIYKAFMAFISKVVRTAEVEPTDLTSFYSGTDEALFLFGPSIDEYASELRRQAVRLRYTNAMLRSGKLSPDKVEATAEENGKVLSWFGEQTQAVRTLLLLFMTPG